MIKRISLFLWISISAITCWSQKSEEFTISSAYVNDQYHIEVMLPNEYDTTKKYPVIYCLDWLIYSGHISNMVGIMDFVSQIDPIIVVGIEAKGGWDAFYTKRNRDFLPPLSTDTSKALSNGAKNFMQFLDNELMPNVNVRYSTDTTKQALSGYSYGGVFGLYVILERPNLFSKYIIGSPSGWYDDFYLVRRLEEMNGNGLGQIENIYLTVGEEEVEKQIKAFTRLKIALTQYSDDLSFQSQIIVGEGHSTAVIGTHLKGIRYLFESQ